MVQKRDVLLMCFAGFYHPLDLQGYFFFSFFFHAAGYSGEIQKKGKRDWSSLTLCARLIPDTAAGSLICPPLFQVVLAV